MKVHELIEKLGKMPQDMEITIPVPEWWEGGVGHEAVESLDIETVELPVCKCGHAENRHVTTVMTPNTKVNVEVPGRCADCQFCPEFSRDTQRVVVIHAHE